MEKESGEEGPVILLGEFGVHRRPRRGAGEQNG